MSTTCILVAGDPRIDALVRAADGTAITAVVVGPAEVAETVAQAGVDAVLRFDPPADAAAECLAGQVARAVADLGPDLVLAANRAADRALAGAVAAALRAPVLSMPATVTAAAGAVEARRPVFGGIAEETVRVAGRAVVLLDGGAAPEPVAPAAPITDVAPAAEPTVRVVETRVAERAAVDLGRAQRIVSVGRGVKAAADLALVEELAGALDAAVACSRPLAEGLNWFEHDRYVGVTGQRVSPQLYVAAGISGQLQHTVGAREAGTVVAINTDAKCPYFAEADYCVVGDLYQVLPALTEALR